MINRSLIVDYLLKKYVYELFLAKFLSLMTMQYFEMQ